MAKGIGSSRKAAALVGAAFLLIGTQAAATGFVPLDDAAWNAKAVRRVLHTFAYGGQATEGQITAWADMAPQAAIAQMLTFDDHNLRLSPGQGDAMQTGSRTLRNLMTFWTSDDPANDTPQERREEFSPEHWEVPARTWIRATRTRGLNPFRNRIGLWETNYHLAVNVGVGVQDKMVTRYYDDIMEGLDAGEPYQDVLTTAATSAAIAMQYGHQFNRLVDNKCECNEDFAREFHQLFYGILGDYAPKVHETQTVKNTARALTDMPIHWSAETGYEDHVSFGTQYHDRRVMMILQQQVQGRTAYDSIASLSQIAIQHPESLENLPVKIIAGLADDNLTDNKIQAIREAWAAMPEKNLLAFLRAYAISTTFHDATRRRYLSSIDRLMTIAVGLTLTNQDAALDLAWPQFGLYEENVRIFAPKRNVFGGQTGLDAVGSATVFQSSYTRSTDNIWIYTNRGEQYGTQFSRDFRKVISKSGTTGYRVDRVAELLWNRFIGDGLKNFGPVERANVYALLARGQDLGYVFNPSGDPDRIITGRSIATHADLVAQLAKATLKLDAPAVATRDEANDRVMDAVAFIVATPYMFVEEGL